MRIVGIPKTGRDRRYKRHLRVRNKVSGTAERPRLVVFRSLKHIYAQLVDDTSSKTIATVSDLNIEKGKKAERGGSGQVDRRARQDRRNHSRGVRSRGLSLSRPHQGGRGRRPEG